MCDCRKKKVIVQPEPIVEEFNTEEIEEHILVPTPMTYDWYNNIDIIEPIKPKEDE